MNNEDIINNAENRLKTTMIGSKAKFEEFFGHLWEDDNPNIEYYDNLWEQTRTAILNHGNNQIRLALNELSDYLYNRRNSPTIKQKYHYKFNFRNRGDNE
jgi:hypothetical protein